METTTRRRLFTAFATVALLIGCWSAKPIHAQTVDHGTLSYQGVLKDQSGSKVTGQHTLIITLYGDANGSTSIWRGNIPCSLNDGVFSVTLGTPSNPLPDPQSMDRPLWVGVSIDGRTEMRPLAQLTGSAYALNVPDKSITAKKIGTDYVSSISINGQKITGPVNFVGSGINYDALTNEVRLAFGGPSQDGGKGAAPQLVTWNVGGNAFSTNCANIQFLGSTTHDNVNLGTDGTTNIKRWDANCAIGCTASQTDRIQVFDATGTSLFEVRNSGPAVDSKVLGASGTVEPGGTYNDNTIIAWAKIPGPATWSLGPNAPSVLGGGVKDFGVSTAAGSSPVWSFSDCLMTLNNSYCNQPLASDPNDEVSITVTLIDDMGTQSGEPFPNPSAYFSNIATYHPAYATVTKLGSQAGTANFPGPLLPNQFIVRTYVVMNPAASSCPSCFGPGGPPVAGYQIMEWPCPFYVKVTARHQ